MQSASRYLIGIDLGTTNTAVAYIDTKEAAPKKEAQKREARKSAPAIQIFQIPQLVREREVGSSETLPSFLYFASEADLAAGGFTLPWQQRPAALAGILAREQGALVPGRQVSSAKSWLCHDAVDRTAKILPWGADQREHACSPVEASTAYLTHIRDAWNYTFAREGPEDDDLRFEHQEIILTVPASFDEEARELTVEAARAAGVKNLTLLEEPLAAFYAWIVNNRASLKRRLKDGDLVLICDVGGGTTDFSLIRVHIQAREVRFSRTAIGKHLLLGGDNVDLALVRRVEEKLQNPKLTLRQRNALARQCCAAKERLLGGEGIERATVSVLGSGRSVVGGTLTTDLSREEVEQSLLDGFLPLTAPDDLPARERRAGLRELGLPYATEPAITKHLAEFLTRSLDAETSQEDLTASNQSAESEIQNSTLEAQSLKMARPDAVLFNGGFFAPQITRERIIEALGGWFREKGKRYKPKVLNNEAPETAVATGAAYYGEVRRAGGLRISGGIARAYYVGVQTASHVEGNRVRAVCVMPRGTEEGTTLELSNREFTVLANRPVSFTLYSSTTAHDQHGDLVTLDEEQAHRHAPLITVLRYGKKSRPSELAVRLVVKFTEVGTLELWCESLKTEHRWRLQFQLRGIEAEAEEPEPESAEAETVIPDEAVKSAERLIHALFGGARAAAAGEQVTPEAIVGRLEAAFGYGKDAWPMAAIRKLSDAMLDVADGRKKSARFEARWLNLFGFCLRPGFGAAVDDWRMSQARRIYLAGLVFPKDIQCQVEWLVLWRRVAGGLNAGQQQELYQRLVLTLGIGAKKQSGRINAQIEYEGWRLVASLEHLPPATRLAAGKALLEKIKESPANKGYLWSLGRMGARIPFYGPLNCVVPVEAAEQWVSVLLRAPEMTVDAASAVVQLGARTDDAARDINAALREKAIAKLTQSAMPDELIESLRTHVAPRRADALRIFGESLPAGLRLVG
jgi:molecular chaperone DnaK (HSP70)